MKIYIFSPFSTKLNATKQGWGAIVQKTSGQVSYMQLNGPGVPLTKKKQEENDLCFYFLAQINQSLLLFLLAYFLFSCTDSFWFETYYSPRTKTRNFSHNKEEVLENTKEKGRREWCRWINTKYTSLLPPNPQPS